MEIFVGNIPPNIKVEELGFLYQTFGPIVFIDIKNRCQPPFAFVLFDNSGSAFNAAVSTNGYQYNGYQFQVKLLTPDDSLSSSVISNKTQNEKKSTEKEKLPKEKEKTSPAKKISSTVKELSTKRYVPPIPAKGKPGSLGDPLRKGLSGAGSKWYLRYLEEGFDAKEARIKAEVHKFLALGCNPDTARRKAEQHTAALFSTRTLKILK